VCVWDLATRHLTRWEGAGRELEALVVGPDGTTVYGACRALTGSNAAWETEILAFDLTTWERKGRFRIRPGRFPWLALSADGRRLAGRGPELLVWDLAIPDHPQLAVISVPAGLPGSPAEWFALSADGTRLVTISNRGVTLWDTANGTPTAMEMFRSGKHRRRVSAVACSPTRPLFATGDTAGQVFLWDQAGHVLTRYDWGLDEVYALCFAPDGLRCAAIDRNGKVVVWDVDV
jgi:WD40 repeat protein